MLKFPQRIWCLWAAHLLRLALDFTYLSEKSANASYSAVSDYLRPHGLQSTRPFCPRDSPGKNTGVCRHSLLQGIFLTQGYLSECSCYSFPLPIKGHLIQFFPKLFLFQSWVNKYEELQLVLWITAFKIQFFICQFPK